MYDEFFSSVKERFIDFIENATSIFLIYHSDPDGVCSSAIMKVWLREYGKRVYLASTKFGLVDIDDELAMKSKSFDKIIILDLSSWNKILDEKLENVCRIDHHLIENKREVLLINPREFNKEVYLPTSYITWRLTDKRKDLAFIAYFGAKLDKCELCDDLYAYAISKYPEIKSIFNEMSEILNVSRYIRSANIVVNLLESLYRTGSPKYLKSTSEYARLSKIKHIINNEISKHVSHPNKVYYDRNLVVIRVCSNFSVHTAIASLYSKFMKENVVVVYNPCISKNDVYFEVRSKQNVYDIFRNSIYNICKSFGGHENAFGFKVGKELLQQVISRIINIKF